MSQKQRQFEETVARVRELSSKTSLSDAEKAELDEGMKDAKTLQAAIQRDASVDEFTRTVSDLTPSRKADSGDVIIGRSSEGYFATAHRAEFEKAAEAMKTKGQWGFDLRYGTKADISDATSEVGSGLVTSGSVANPPQYGASVAPFYYPGIIEPATRQPTIADLFAQGSTDSNLVRLVKESVTVNGAAPVAEGAAYGLSEIQVRPHDWPVRDIATLLPVTEDILMDVPAMASYLSMRVGKFVQLEEERELIHGNGTGSHLEGILGLEGLTWNGQGSQSISGAVVTLLADVYAESFMDPSWVVMSPRTWAAYVLEREDGNSGAFLAGSVTQNPARTIWGLPIVVTAAVPDDKVLVGNPQAGMIFRNGGLRVESSTGYGTFFGEGLVAIRAKVRTAFAVFRPSAIGVLNLGS